MSSLKELLSDDNGQLSATRVMAMISLFIGSGIGVYGIYAGKDFSGVAEICAVFVGSAFGAKVIQKQIESK